MVGRLLNPRSDRRNAALGTPLRPVLRAVLRGVLRALLGVLAVLALVVSVAGCAAPWGSAQQQEQEDLVEPVELAARPGLEQAVARYEQMQQRVRDRLDAELGPFAWEQRREESRSPCGAQAPGADRVYMARWRIEGGVPDRDWPRAREILVATAAEYGFTVPGMAIDTPGHHRTTTADPSLGALFDFRTQVNAVMGVTTGCHPAV